MSRFLTAFTTYGSPALIDLQLHYMTRFSDKSDIVVCDDCSSDNRLSEVCSRYGVELVTLPAKSAGADIGDLNLLVLAMELANERGYDYLLKVSRSFIIMESPFYSLEHIIEQSDGNTFSNKVARFNYGFNTACICYRVRDWVKLLPDIRRKSEEFAAEHPEFVYLRVEAFIHNLARSIQPSTEKYLKYQSIHYREEEEDGYVRWDWMGEQWHRVPKHIIWHDDTTPERYCEIAEREGLSGWTPNDFRR